MTIDQLRVFCKVARRLNLSAVAAELRFTQSAISQQIIALERSMNVRLFDRVGRRLELASAGEELLEIAEPFVKQLDKLQDNLQQSKHTVQGRLVVGASATLGTYLLPRLVAEFKKRYPKVELTLLTHSSEETLQLLGQRRVHIAFVEAQPARRWEQDFVFHPFSEDELVLIAPPGMNLASEPLKRKDLAKLPLLLRASGSGTRKLLLERLAAYGLAADDLNVLFELGHTEALKQSVSQGLGAAFVPRLSLTDADERHNLLRVVHVDPALDLRRHLFVVQRQGESESRVLQVFEQYFWKSAYATVSRTA